MTDGPMRKPLLLFASPGALDDRADATGSRYVQMAQALASAADVLVAAPGETTPPARVQVVRYESQIALHALVHNCDIAVLPAALFERFPALVWAHARLVVDLHDGLVPQSPARRVGDFFLCRSEEERQAWLRMLFEHGRLSGASYRSRRGQDRFAAVVTSTSVEELRAYCASVLQETSSPWSTPRAALQAWRVLRQNGAATFLRVALAHLRG
jgi:hypothetical protein